MLTYNCKRLTTLVTAFFGCGLIFYGCTKNQGTGSVAPPIRDVSSVRLNFRYEADVPAPADETKKAVPEERNTAVQSDFDTNRSLELLDRTLSSPDKKRIAAVYHRLSDVPAEFRIDMYTSDGKLLKKLTSDTMAVHFPDTIVWSPDSSALAFVAMVRAGLDETATVPAAPTPAAPSDSGEPATPTPVTTPAPPTGILTFHTEQIYICSAEGTGVKPITNNESLIYFYYVWSPDSMALAALATTSREWRYLEVVAANKGEVMVPLGRPRIIERNGRERRLDDNLTAVRPVWSPDSAKVADAFDTQVRIYDAEGTNPTQAAIPLRNQLLISSQAYDRDQQRKLQASAANADPNAPAPQPDQPLSTLPDEKLLVSYNPIVTIAWPADDMLYLETAYVRRMLKETDSARSFSRWHRVILTSQVMVPAR